MATSRDKTIDIDAGLLADTRDAMKPSDDVPESFDLRGGAKLHDDEIDPAWRDPTPPSGRQSLLPAPGGRGDDGSN